jgi:excisionase family DNA binding protein
MLVTAKQVAEELQCSISTVYALAKRGEIPSVKIGDLVRFSLERVQEALENKSAHRPAVVRPNARPNAQKTG